MASDDTPGSYETVDGIKQRAMHFDQPAIVDMIEAAEDRIYESEGGYGIEAPEDSGPDSVEMLFHLGILTGAALEREYPAAIEGGDGS